MAASPWSPFSHEALEEIREEVKAWNPDGEPFRRSGRVYENPEDVRDYLLGLLSFRLEDDSTLTQVVERAILRARGGDGKDMATAVANTLQVLQAARSWDAAKAIQYFNAARVPLPSFSYTFYSPLTTQDYSRLVIGKLLFDQGRYEEALSWFVSIFDGHDFDGAIYAAPAYYHIAQIHEELGQSADAITYYERFLDFWRDADSELQPIVEEAKRRLDSLLDAMTEEL